MNEELLHCPIETEVIEKYLPHRNPFLLIDRVLSYDLDSGEHPTLTAIKNITINEPFFPGHFPGNPVMPGVLIIESMAQACGMLAHVAAATAGEKGLLYYLVKVDKAKFNKVVKPGDQLELVVSQTRIMRGLGQYVCQANVDGKKAASCEILCAGRGK